MIDSIRSLAQVRIVRTVDIHIHVHTNSIHTQPSQPFLLRLLVLTGMVQMMPRIHLAQLLVTGVT